MEMTRQQLESLVYRKDQLQEKLQNLEALISGKGKRFLPLVQTKTGRHSEKRTWALVEDLLNAIEECESYRWYWSFNGTQLSSKSKFRMSEQRRTFWRSFLYCAIRFAGNNPRKVYDCTWNEAHGGVFGDIVYLADQMEYDSKAELHFAELFDAPKWFGFFSWMDFLYEKLTGQSMASNISEEDRRAVWEQFPDQAKKADEEKRERDGTESWLAGLTPEELCEVMADEDDWSEPDPDDYDAEKEQEEWIRAFPNKESFCAQYLTFHDLFFQECGNFRSTIERAMDIYLCQREMSGYLDDDTFFSAYGLVDRAVQQMRELSEAEDFQ